MQIIYSVGTDGQRLVYGTVAVNSHEQVEIKSREFNGVGLQARVLVEKSALPALLVALEQARDELFKT